MILAGVEKEGEKVKKSGEATVTAFNTGVTSQKSAVQQLGTDMILWALDTARAELAKKPPTPPTVPPGGVPPVRNEAQEQRATTMSYYLKTFGSVELPRCETATPVGTGPALAAIIPTLSGFYDADGAQQSRLQLPYELPLKGEVSEASAATLLTTLDALRALRGQRLVLTRGQGVGAVEVPRGILFHDYTYDENGVIQKANLVIPTNQNHANIEQDMKEWVPVMIKEGICQSEIASRLETLVRAYDPCISCSTHLLKVDFE